MKWIDVKEALPPAKEGWDHSERVVLFYPSNETQTTDYGIGYYHYNPPLRLLDLLILHTTDVNHHFGPNFHHRFYETAPFNYPATKASSV